VLVIAHFLLLFLIQENHSFIGSYKVILSQKGLYYDESDSSSIHLYTQSSVATLTSQISFKFTDEDVEKVKDGVMTLLRNHSNEGELCCCMDENNLQVVNVDTNGFVTAVRCTRPCINENCTCRVNIVETICDDDKWTYEEVDDEVPIYKGDHICWNRPYALWHHAIVTKVEGANIHYIHYSNSKTVEEKIVPRDKLAECGRKCCCSCFVNECNTLYRVNYQDCYTSEYTIMRAEKLREEKKFDLTERNCEHFSHYCKTGSTSSSQINIAWTSLGNVIVSTGLKAVTVLLLLSIARFANPQDAAILNSSPRYIIMVIIVFVIYLAKTSASRLSKVPVKPATMSDQNTCVRILFRPCLCVIICLFRNVCIRSLFRSCISIVGYVCCNLCNNVSCRECTCYRRQGHLVCGVFIHIFIREMAAAAASVLAIWFLQGWVVFEDSLSPYVATITIIVILLLGHIAGYIIGTFIGRWVEAVCLLCCRCCPKTAVSTPRARNGMIQV